MYMRAYVFLGIVPHWDGDLLAYCQKLEDLDVVIITSLLVP
jgi:hypothetical protein